MSGTYGTPEEVFFSSITIAEYVPPSEGKTDGFAVKVRLIPFEDCAVDCFAKRGSPGTKIPKENKNSARIVRVNLSFEIESDLNSTLECRVKMIKSGL